MVQGNMKLSKRPGQQGQKAGGKSAKIKKVERKLTQPKTGNPRQLPKGEHRLEAMRDRLLTKEIGKTIEQKVAAKLLADGMKLNLKDIVAKGKELNRETKRKLLKKKVGRVQEKLQILEDKAEQMEHGNN